MEQSEDNSTEQSAEQSEIEPPEPDVYSIILYETENGAIFADKLTAVEGETVTLTVTPDSGYALSGIELNGEALEELTFEMPASDVIIIAEFEAVVYSVTIAGCEHGTVLSDKNTAIKGETVTLTIAPETAYRLEALTVNGEELIGATFKMPAEDVTIEALFVEIFAKGENIGYAGAYVSTEGVDVSLDNGSVPVTTIGGGYEQYAYFNDVLAEKLYFAVDINVKKVLNGDQYPKFGLFLHTEEGRAVFYAAMSSIMTADTVGRAYSDGNVYNWDKESLSYVGAMSFTGEGKVTFALVRDGGDVYFYVNGVLAMYEENTELFAKGNLSAAGFFSFNTELELSGYSILCGEEAIGRIAVAKADVLRINGETYGNAGNYTSSSGVDLTFDRGEEPYAYFDGDGSPMFAYIEELNATRIYYEADFNVLSVKNGDQYPKFGMFAQTTNKTLFFYVDMTTELTATTVGVVYVRNGVWDWNNARSVKVENMTFTGEDSVKLSMSRNGADFIFLVNGEYAISVIGSELYDVDSYIGAFGFNTEMKVASTLLDDDEERAVACALLIPKVGYSANGVAYCLNDYVYDPETDTISVMHASSNVRTIATYYVDGLPVYKEAFVVEGKVRIFNTKTTGTAASKVELQVGRNTTNFFKMLIYRYEASTTNDSIYIEGANQKDNGNIALKRIKYNTLPSGDDCTLEYKVIYDHGVIYLVIDGEVQLVYESGWKEAGYSFGVLQYADTIWSDTVAVLDESAVEDIVSEYKNDYMAFKSATYLEKDAALASGDELILSDGEGYRVGGSLRVDASFAGKASLIISSGENALAEYSLKKTSSGKWMVEKIVGGETKTIVPPTNITVRWMNFELVTCQSKIAFMLDGKVYDVTERGEVGELTVSANVTGGGATLKNTYYYQFETMAESDEYIDNAPVYSYYSNYSSRINNLYNEYIASGDSVKGGVLILGSSTMDFWDTWAEDLSLVDKKTGYNVGIGGTTSEDWLFAYDKLVKPFDPSCVLIFVGGNDLNVNGARATDTAKRIEKLIEKIHFDFPSADIYYIYSLACPSCYAGGRWTKGEFDILVNALKDYCDGSNIVTGINVNGVLVDENGDPKDGFFRPDGIHMTDIGYAAWTEYLLGKIDFPATLGKRYIASGFDGVESCYAPFGEQFAIDLAGTEYEGNEGLTIIVTDENGDTVPVTKNGDVFTFIMPALNVTLTAQITASFTNAILVDNGTLIKGVYNSFSTKESDMIIPKHFAYEDLYGLLPEAIRNNDFVYGYAVSSDNGETFGEIATDIGNVVLSEGDILKVCFVMMGSAASGNSNYNSASFNALENTLTLGNDDNTSSTRYWGALYKDGKLYTGNDYTVTMHLELYKNLSTRNYVCEIQVSNMPAKDVYRGRKVYLRFENNATVLKRQMTETLTTGYNAGWTKTNTAITVSSTAVLTIELDVTIVVTPQGFTLTVVNSDNNTQTYSESYVFNDEKYEWKDVNVCLADVQIGRLTVSDITFTDNSATANADAAAPASTGNEPSAAEITAANVPFIKEEE